MQCRQPVPEPSPRLVRQQHHAASLAFCMAMPLTPTKHWNILGNVKSVKSCAPENMERLIALACFLGSHLGAKGSSDVTMHLLHR